MRSNVSRLAISLALVGAANIACMMSPAVQIKQDRFRPDADSVQLDVNDAFSVKQDVSDILFSSEFPHFDLWMMARPPVGGVADTSVRVMLSSTSRSGWKYLKCHHLSFLVDGRPYSVEGEKHDGNVGTGYVSEHISFDVPRALVDEMGRGRVVEGKLCNTEFAFTPNTLGHVRSFVTAVHTGQLPVTTP
jgi:hypothetical protein